jgi:hypothetical protein
MIRDKTIIKGKVTATVFGPDGQIKRRKQNLIQRLLGLPGSLMISANHNIITDQGDALVADLMTTTPARQKVDNTNGRVTVGTGWTGTNPKQNTACNTPTGSADTMEATYPKIKGAFGAANDNVVQYRVVFTAGALDATGIDEAALHNTTVDNLAYAQVTPSVDVTTTDTLQVDWEITFLGS